MVVGTGDKATLLLLRGSLTTLRRRSRGGRGGVGTALSLVLVTITVEI